MANKRMFSAAVIESDAFLDLPPKSQNLYIHLNMRADDDGFASPKSTMRATGCTDADLRHLVDANFVILFDSGMVCIVDWKENNYIKSDRYKPTQFQRELSCLGVDAKTKRYYVISSDSSAELPEPEWKQVGSKLEPQYRIEEKRVVESSKEKDSNAATAASAPDTEPFDIFADFANGDEELLKALRDYDQMRREKHKSLTQTMRRSLCQQLDEEFQPCEWVEIIKQATRQGWLKFYPLDKDTPTNTPTMDDNGKAQLDRILNNLKNMNRGNQL